MKQISAGSGGLDGSGWCTFSSQCDSESICVNGMCTDPMEMPGGSGGGGCNGDPYTFLCICPPSSPNPGSNGCTYNAIECQSRCSA